MTDRSKINVVLFVGGISPECSVSKETSEAMFKACNELGYNVKLIDPGYGLNQPEKVEDYFLQDKSDKSSKNILETINSELLDNTDVVLLGLHGDWGEDGRIQSALEMRGIPYTGSGVLASALAMDKSLSKSVFKQYGIPTANWIELKNNELEISEIKIKIKDIGYPVVIKPNTGGSTIGLTIVNEEDAVDEAINRAFEVSGSVIIEKYIKGRELTVGILDGKALPILEIKPKNDLYDFECKYTDGMSEYIVPAEIPENIFAEIKIFTEKAFHSLGCKDFARIDFLLNEAGEYYCLEVNTLPGMTSHSLLPMMANSVGINFNSLVDKMIQMALK